MVHLNHLAKSGALRPDNYDRHASWISNTPIDLNSRHPRIQEQDFLRLDPASHGDRWDVISLSLVLNFVPKAADRGAVQFPANPATHISYLTRMLAGAMLRIARSFLRPRTGLLYFVIPAPCIENSRYLNRDRLSHIFTAVGLTPVKERLKSGGKLAYFLVRRTEGQTGIRESTLPPALTTRVTLREGASRNNFCILL
jgi:25S rRNA (adenine2142-N1)-methyltransferase